MKLENLKVGDRVKYKIEHGISGTNHSTFENAEGKILAIYLTFFQIKNNKYCGEQISVKKENIISYLEPIIGGPWEQYMEIKIEHENPRWNCKCGAVDVNKDWLKESKATCKVCGDCYQNKTSIKLSELEIGDKIKFQLPNSSITKGTINKIYSDSFIVDGNHVSEKYVISKLEGILDPMTSSKIPIFYTEIPIEKEYPTLKCNNCGQFYFEKAFCGDVCFKCIEKDKEKPTPKSFKFNIRITELSQETEYWNGKNTNSISGYSISLGKTIRFENFPVPEWIDFNKEYIIEIKEKE